MACAQGISRRVPPLIIIAFFFTFMGPAVVQVFLRNLVPADWGAVKVTAILAALYFSFMFWRLLVVKTQHWMGDKWSLVFGVAAYMLVPAALIFTTSYALLVVLAILWGWGAAAIWLTGPVWLYDNTNPARRGFWAGVLYMVLFAGLYIGTLRRVGRQSRLDAFPARGPWRRRRRPRGGAPPARRPRRSALFCRHAFDGPG